MSNLDELGDAMAKELARIQAVLDRYGYDATPTIILRHNRLGPEGSIVMGNDSRDHLMQCIDRLFTDPNGKTRYVETAQFDGEDS